MRSKDPFSWIEASEEKRLNRYREPKEARNPELWVSSRYDFTDPAVWREYVPEERCIIGGKEYVPSVGACISAIQKSWISIKRANEGKERRNEDEPIEDIMIRVNRIQKNLGMLPYRFSELEAIGYYDEQEEDEARQIAWGEDEDDGQDEPVFFSQEERDLWREQKA